jgi:hypothetical protein
LIPCVWWKHSYLVWRPFVIQPGDRIAQIALAATANGRHTRKGTTSRRQPKSATGGKEFADGLPPFSRIGTDSNRTTPARNRMTVPAAQHPFRMKPGTKEIDEDIGVEKDLPAYRYGHGRVSAL